MAQASSAQREPSMEEILASIRRIIEDNESGRQDEGPDTADDAIEDAAADMETFRAELTVANTQSQPTEAAGDAADAGRDSGALEAFRRPEPDVAAPEEPAEAADKPFTIASSVQSEEATSGLASFSVRPKEEVVQDQERAVHSGPPAPELQDAAPSAPVQGREGGRPAMLSEASGRKVAAAFEELSDAFEATRRKNLTEAAEEMLRPMLQEWLDNNLPQLVERLVREEIERIARGG